MNQDFKVDPQFLNQKSSLKLVFVTYSPVLTNEVKKFYTDIKVHFVNELVTRREKQLQKNSNLNEEVKGDDKAQVFEEVDELKE